MPYSSSDDDDNGFDVNLVGEEFDNEVDRRRKDASRVRDNFFRGLFQALLVGNLERLEECFAHPEYIININAPLFSQWNPLLMACQSGSMDCVQFLLNKGADLHVKCNDVTCLMAACDSVGDSAKVMAVVRHLLDLNVDMNHTDFRGRTALMYAAQSGQLEAVRHLAMWTRINTVDVYGRSALFYAVESNHIEVVRALLDAGAKTDVIDHRGDAVLSVAQQKDLQDIVYLLESRTKGFVVPIEPLNPRELQDNNGTWLVD